MPRKELAERHQVRIALVIKPSASVHEIGAEVTQMGDRAAERGQAQFKEGQEHLQGGPARAVCVPDLREWSPG